MKFYCDEIPTLMVWDAETDKPLRFVGGVYTTTDPRICHLLADGGYRYDGKLPKKPEEAKEGGE